MPPSSTQSAAFAPTATAISRSRKALVGFSLSGLVLSFLGAILPAWGYHLSFDYAGAGACFLLLNVGLLAATRATTTLIRRQSMPRLLSAGAFTAAAAFLMFALTLPPASVWWRYAGSLVLGFGAGLASAVLLYATTPLYDRDRARTLNLAGVSFGFGCVLTALLIAATFYVYTVTGILLIFAGIAAVFGAVFSRWTPPEQPLPDEQARRRALAEFKSPGAVLFALLLFFQFGNEWALACWLPLFLIQRLGVSPETSLFMLALFWSALLAGRLAVQLLLPRVSHLRLLLASMLGPVFGCIVLAFTNNLFGAIIGVLCTGLGFAAILPLVSEKISARFPHYHPGVFSGLWAVALTGGLLAPWTIGLMAEAWGIRAVMAVPLPGSLMVFLLMLLILLEKRLSEGQAE